MDHVKAACGNCIYFQNDPAILEKAWPGLSSMSSGFGSVRDQDGLCKRHDVYLSSWDSCPRFLPQAVVAKTPPVVLS